MKPPNSARSLSDIRVTRKTKIDLHLGDSHGWAVSYADLLMVLLSFFVIYASFSDEDPATVDQRLRKLSLTLPGEQPKSLGTGSKPEVSALTNLAEALKIDGIKLTKNNDHLLVELGEGVFRSGGYSLSPELQTQVSAVLERLQPFDNKISLTIIGHADRIRQPRRNEFLQDNFDLSSLRALRVLKFAIAKGFPANRGSARAASSYDRDARSITFELRLAPAVAEGSGA